MPAAVPKIVLNGEPRELIPGTTIATLLDELRLDARTVAVERNRSIVPRARYAETSLETDDRLEVVTFVGGG